MATDSSDDLTSGSAGSPRAVDRLCARLRALPPARQRLLIRNSRRVARPEVVRRLLERSHDLRHQDPAEGLRLVRLALAILPALRLKPDHQALGFDLRAEAWALKANHHRIREEYEHAEKAWPRAESFLTRGSGEPGLAARLCDLKSSLRRAQRRFQEALALLQRAESLYESAGKRRSVGKARLQRASVHHFAGDLSGALDAHYQAGEALDLAGDPVVRLGYLHNLAGYLADAGHLAHAAFLIRRCRHLYDQAGSDLIRLRGRYLQGRLAAYEERWGEAITCLETARKEFIDRGMPYLAALAGLDLALVWVRLRRHREVFRLALEMYPVFVAKEIPREASAAFLLFVQAAQEYEATVEVIQEVYRRLQAQGEALPPGARWPALGSES